MKHTEAKQLLYVDRYLAGMLSGEDQAAFEAHILTCQECLDDLELTEKLRQGVRDAFGEVTHSEPPAVAARTASSNGPRYATAASVLIAGSMLAAGLMYERHDGLQSPAAAEVFPIHATRSVGNAPSSLLRLSSPGATAVLLVDPGLTDFDEYKVHVWRAAGDDTARGTAIVTELDGLQPTYEDMLAVSIPAADLPPGDYQIDLSGRADRTAPYERVTSLQFRVID
jgi:anti-sigma factor RsiW